MTRMQSLWGVLLATLGGILAPSLTAAQTDDYPQRPIRLVVGVPPGGATDHLARLVAAKLTERLGQQVVVDNRSGASGIIAFQMVAKSPPDGYTLLIAGSSITIVGSLYTHTKFDVQRDLEPLAVVATTPYVMVAHPSIGVKTVSELISYAKSRGNKISWSAGALGAVQHLSGEMFKRRAGIEMVYIPYKGAGAMLPDIVEGRLQVAFENVLVLLPHIKRGTLNALAVTTAKRTPILPDVPSLDESGLTGFDTSGWFSMYLARKTPLNIVKKLNAEIIAIVNTPDVGERLLALGATPLPGTPENLRQLLSRDVPAWRKVIHDAGLKAE